jgi:hypothetical protein
LSEPRDFESINPSIKRPKYTNTTNHDNVISRLERNGARERTYQRKNNALIRMQVHGHQSDEHPCNQSPIAVSAVVHES